MFRNYNHLGFYNPFYIRQKGKLIINEKFSAIVAKTGTSPKIDTASVIQFLKLGHMLGDRTIIKDISKTPWMARPNEQMDGWDYYKLKISKNRKESVELIAEELFQRLQKEILSYVGESKTVGILLSGGMDSRIVAGTLHYLINKGKIANITIKAFTWGNSDSRDVIYSREIAESLGWEWKHFQITSESLMNNIDVTADFGCEYSPIHLHAIPQIKEERGLDCILAGSYGDSMGRAEYEGVKVQNLSSLDTGFRNFGSLIKVDAYKAHISEVESELKKYHDLFPQLQNCLVFEQDKQIHYMRRKLNPCMAVLNEDIPVYQAFTSPEIFEFIWSIDPGSRTDKIYEVLMGFFEKELSDIPWARTGIKYGQISGKKDKYKKSNHSYAEIINKDLISFLEDRVLSDSIKRLGIFNRTSLITLVNLLKITPVGYNLVYGERLCWLASLALLVEKHNITQTELYQRDTLDLINGVLIGPGEILLRTMKEAYRKLRLCC